MLKPSLKCWVTPDAAGIALGIVQHGPAAFAAEIPGACHARLIPGNSCADASAQPNAMASATPAPSRKRFLIPLTSGRKYACDDGYATTVALMITIDFCDGNRFLAREARQSGRRRKTPPTATFMQQFARNPANSPDVAETFAQHQEKAKRFRGQLGAGRTAADRTAAAAAARHDGPAMTIRGPAGLVVANRSIAGWAAGVRPPPRRATAASRCRRPRWCRPRPSARSRSGAGSAGRRLWGRCRDRPLAAERLHPDDGADHVAVDIGVADAEPAEDVVDGVVDPAVDAEGQAVAGGGDLVEHRGRAGRPASARHAGSGRTPRASSRAGAVDLEGTRREEAAVLGAGRQRAAIDAAGPRAPSASAWRCSACRAVVVDDRADIGREQRRVADRAARPSRRPASAASGRRCRPARYSRRNAEQRWPALSKAEVSTSATTCSGSAERIDDHRVLAAGLGDQRHDRPGARAPARG